MCYKTINKLYEPLLCKFFLYLLGFGPSSPSKSLVLFLFSVFLGSIYWFLACMEGLNINNLSLQEDEEEGGFCFDMEEGGEDVCGLRLCLVGRFLCDRQFMLCL